MSGGKRVSKVVPCGSEGPMLPHSSGLRALALFSNVSRDGDYALGAVSNRPLPDGTNNVFLVQHQYKLQFMFELADALTTALGEATANNETQFSFAKQSYHGSELFLVYQVKVHWTPEGNENVNEGLLLSLEAALFENACNCEVHIEAEAILGKGARITFFTDDWRQGAILSRGYYYGRVDKVGLQVLEIDQENHAQKVQIV